MNIYLFPCLEKRKKICRYQCVAFCRKNNIDLLNVSPSRTFSLTRCFVNNGLEYLLEKYYLNKLK